MTRAWGSKLVLSMACALGAGPLAGCIDPRPTDDCGATCHQTVANIGGGNCGNFSVTF